MQDPWHCARRYDIATTVLQDSGCMITFAKGSRKNQKLDRVMSLTRVNLKPSVKPSKTNCFVEITDESSRNHSYVS